MTSHNQHLRAGMKRYGWGIRLRPILNKGKRAQELIGEVFKPPHRFQHLDQP